jgi:hypothetical protein
MKTFKQFIANEEMTTPAVANTTANIATYDPIMVFKMFRRKRKKEKIQ